MELCKSIKVTHYPTLMFIGSGPFYDTDPITKLLLGKDKSAGVMGESPVPNTVKFQGNWQYTDSILDWIKTMQALSRWHTWSTKGFGKRLRNLILREKIQNEQLPLGVPGRSASSDSSSSSSSSVSSLKGGASSSTSAAATDADIEYLQKQVEKWQNATDDITKVAVRTATMLDSVLFENEKSTDMFTLLDERDAWKDMKSATDLKDIYRFCVMEVALDYCQRFAETVGNKVVDKLIASDLSSEELMAASDNMDTLIMDELNILEPYCGILDTCIASDMKDESCRPKTCPFINENACRYTTSCYDPSVVVEYAEALKLDMDTLMKSSSPAPGAGTGAGETVTATEQKKKGGWGAF